MKKLCPVALALVLSLLNLCGPVYGEAIMTLVPRLTLAEEYTDNVDLDRSDQREEWTTVVSPSLDFSALWKTRSLRLSYSPGFAYAAKDQNYSEIRQDLSARFSDQVSKRLRLSVSETLQRTELPYTLEEPVFRRPGTLTEPTAEQSQTGFSRDQGQEGIVERRRDRTVRRNREPYTQSTTSVSADYRFGAKDRFTASYLFGGLWNDDPDVEDNRRHSPRLAVTWWPWDRYGVDAQVQYERIDYSGKTDFTNDYQGHARLLRAFSEHLQGFVGYRHTVSDAAHNEDDYQVFEPFLGVDWEPSKDFFAGLSVGYFYKENKTGSNDSGLTFSGDLGKSWRFRRGSIRLSGGTGYEQSYGGAENLGFTVYYQAMIAGNYALSRRIDAFAGFSAVRNEYLDEDPQRNDNIYSATTGLRYRMLRWLYLNMTYAHQRLDSNVNENDYKENRVVISVNLVPEYGLRFK
ncbi:outer membrane beta-barrel protein [Desulfosoma sp.]|uniref:outer membrane beta-barrel protein n=1 Tax=Desulfosoma sp. TaxID=2603217 RepID=UPI004049FAC4